MAALGAVGQQGSPDDLSMSMFTITVALPAATLSISGVIYDDTATVAERVVRAYRRSDGVLLGEDTSNAGTGAYSIALPPGEVYRVVLDDSAGTLYNDLIDRVIPA
jgi:hypothetical protein